MSSSAQAPCLREGGLHDYFSHNTQLSRLHSTPVLWDLLSRPFSYQCFLYNILYGSGYASVHDRFLSPSMPRI